MIKPVNLHLINFMSHKDSKFEFINGRAVLLYGENCTDEGQVSNGSGKSAILEAIGVSLIATSLRDSKVSVKELVNDQGAVFCELTSEWENQQNNHVMKIVRRFFNSTKSSECEIYINGKQEKLADVDAHNVFILEWIGISRDDLLNYFLISKDKYTSFFKMSDTKKKEVIGRFSQSNLIDPADGLITTKVDEYESEIHQVQRRITTNSGKIELIDEELLEYDKNTLVQIRIKRKIELEAQIKALEEKKVELVSSDIAVRNQLDIDENLHTNFIGDVGVAIQKAADVTEERSLKANDLRFEQVELQETKNLMTKYNNILAGVITCPECSHEFVIDSEKSLEDIKKLMVKLDDVEKDIISSIKRLTGEAELIEVKYDEAKQEILKAEQTTRTIQVAITQAKQTINYNEKLIASEVSRMTSISQEIAELALPLDDKSTRLEERKQLLEEEIAKDSEEILAIQKKMFIESETQMTLVKFKTHLANKTIKIIEAYCNEYLERIGASIILNLEGYKMLKSKKVREQISASVERNGVDKGSVFKLSNGERARIEVCIILALQRLINMASPTGGLDLCFLDETVEGLDELGVSNMIQALNSLNQTIMMVTFSRFELPYKHIVKVVKENDESKIYVK